MWELIKEVQMTDGTIIKVGDHCEIDMGYGYDDFVKTEIIRICATGIAGEIKYITVVNAVLNNTGDITYRLEDFERMIKSIEKSNLKTDDLLSPQEFDAHESELINEATFEGVTFKVGEKYHHKRLGIVYLVTRIELFNFINIIVSSDNCQHKSFLFINKKYIFHLLP